MTVTILTGDCRTGKSALWERAVNIGQVVNCGPKAQFFEAVRVRKALGVE